MKRNRKSEEGALHCPPGSEDGFLGGCCVDWLASKDVFIAKDVKIGNPYTTPNAVISNFLNWDLVGNGDLVSNNNSAPHTPAITPLPNDT